MRLVLPAPLGDRPTEPLPRDLESWRRHVLGAARVVSREERQTHSGWPVTLVRTTEPALIGFYRFLDRCAVVTARASGPGALDELRALFLAADVDSRSA